MANIADIRNGILSTPLREQPVTIEGWDYPLIIRELSGKVGSALVKMSTGADNTLDQENLIAGIILSTLRSADDPAKPLIFGKADAPEEPDPIYKDQLMATGLGRIMEVAQASIKLSGLDQATEVKAAKND